jgi:hypothetical protein
MVDLKSKFGRRIRALEELKLLCTIKHAEEFVDIMCTPPDLRLTCTTSVLPSLTAIPVKPVALTSPTLVVRT